MRANRPAQTGLIRSGKGLTEKRIVSRFASGDSNAMRLSASNAGRSAQAAKIKDQAGGRRARRRRWPPRITQALALLLLAAFVATAAALPRAWRETQRREAYLPQLEAMARQDPYDGRLLALLGARQMEAGETAQAADTLEHALTAGEKTDDVWLGFAAAKAASGERRAPTYLRVAMQQGRTPALVAAAARCAALPKTASNHDIAQAILPLGPGSLADAYSRGSVLNGIVEWWGRRHPDRSGFATRQDWADEESENAQAQLLWAQALLENRRVPEAADVLQRALALAPNSPDAHLTVGQLLESQGQSPQAALEYVTCLKLRPDWQPALLGLGRTLMAAGLPATARKVYADATRVAPDSADAWVGLGQAQAASAGDVNSLQPFQTASRLAPSRTDFFDTYAQSLMANGRWDEAEAVLRRRLTAAPEDVDCLYQLGKLLLHDNVTPARAAEAKTLTEKALRLDPQYESLRQQMADILLRAGKPREAAAWIQHQFDAVQGDVGVPSVAAARVNALLTLARADRQIGLTAQADRAAQQATTFSHVAQQISALKTRAGMDPLNMGVHQKLADLYVRAGQPAGALRERQTIAVLSSSPSQPGQGPETMETIVSGVLPKS